MGETYLINNKLAYVVYSPADSGTGMASEYLHLLVSGNDTIQNFGVRRFTNLTYKFAFNDKKELLFLDDQHFLPEDTNYLAIYKGNQLIGKKPFNFTHNKAYLSPNGKYMVYFTQAMEAFVVNLKNFDKTKIEKPQKELHAIVWSADGNNLALVQDHETYIGTDEILIYSIK
ncbi:hypothetical protein [Niabella ginsengisoli]|uniref:Dipeptidylpeptidase IV N-terminal domain-containing protein n=1 Tax=Niabella ginsengisoli TaxID=522298 RepID=A0ABS9SPQ8_9BACT|nr:hypothetical protein [Niabella ginsengisoli]MCH5600251.1 hypothetical protein [Niabella ginsengisoli]